MQESKKHTKHTALIKPIGGEYHRNEWALIGAPCGMIQKVAQQIDENLRQDLKIGYLDAAHQAPERLTTYHSLFTDKITHQSFSTLTQPEQKQSRKFFNELDVLLVNGNHFKGAKQIVFITEKKKESLSRKLDRLTDIRLILVEEKGVAIHDYLKDIIPPDTPILSIDELEKITQLIRQDFENNTPPLFGLVLAGGKSQRMGTDKGALDYHGKAHREYSADLLANHCEQVYLSFRAKQESIETEYSKLYDTFTGLGPYGAILSAFREQPNHAWLSVACDLPFLTGESIQQLVQERDPSKLATCFHNPDTKFPEPLITIWEPRAYPVLLEFLSQGYSCPRKVLINTDVHEIKRVDVEFMTNANDKLAYEAAKKKINELR